MGLFDWFRRKKKTPPFPPYTGGQIGPLPAIPVDLPPATPKSAPTPPPLPVGRGTSLAQTASSPQSPPSNAPKLKSPPAPESLDYDLGPFAPISDAELRAGAAKVTSAFSNLWLYGRTTRIPPAEDPRTHLIDRAMVSQGLLSPQELADIHAVGRTYDEVRPDLQVELDKARATVARSEVERAERKQQKRAEAAERKRQHAAAVARRRETDIVYLGRGVSSLLHDRRSDLNRLAALGLPALSTPADVASATGLTVRQLRWLAFHSEAATSSHYVTFDVAKRSGGTRRLSAPHETLAAAQTWILENVLSRVLTHDAAHGFVPGRSTLTNAQPHVGRAVLVNADLKDFFPTISFGRVRGIFKQLGYSPAVATVFALLCTESPRQKIVYAGKPFYVASGPRTLPQGACTSPALSNLAARRLDSRLSGIARRLGFVYTRYADDLTFSGDADLNPKVGYLLARLRHIAQDEGFAVNEAKTRVQRPHTAQTVTGLVVNEKPGVPRQTVRRLRAILHRAQFEGLEAQNREGRPHFRAWVQGMIAYVQMVDPKRSAPLRAAFEALPEMPNP